MKYHTHEWHYSEPGGQSVYENRVGIYAQRYCWCGVLEEKELTKEV